MVRTGATPPGIAPVIQSVFRQSVRASGLDNLVSALRVYSLS